MSPRKQTALKTLQSKMRGVGLIEVLVAVLVLAIGLLGLAGLQASGIRANTSSVMRSQSVMLGYNILDSIRANPSANYTIDLDQGPPSTTGCLGTGSTCSSNQMAAYDLAVWKCSLGKYNDDNTCQTLGIEGLMPEGDGSIEQEAGGRYTITIEWLDDRDSEEPKQFTMSAQI